MDLSGSRGVSERRILRSRRTLRPSLSILDSGGVGNTDRGLLIVYGDLGTMFLNLDPEGRWKT